MTTIYIDDPAVLKFADEISGHTVTDINEFISSADSNKIAFTAMLHQGNLSDEDFAKSFVDYVTMLSKFANKVFVVDGEYTINHHILMKKYNNVYWIILGLTSDPRVIFWGDLFQSTADLYKKLPDKLEAITYQTTKPKYFDALMGLSKPHRRYVYHKIIEEKLEDKIIVSLEGKTDFVYEPDTNIINNSGISSDKATYFGQHVNVSQIIPIDIFNQTAYSIITESFDDSKFSIFSEKIVKPIIARRLFVVFSGYNFLKNLKRLGFKTFDGIIDEGYDQILPSKERYDRAFDQVKYLCSIDQQEVYKNIHDIVNYNYQLVNSTDWIKYVKNQIGKVL